MYRIGIIDDVKSERDDIQVSILDNVNAGTGVEFKEYVLEHKTKDTLFNEIREDVSDEVIQALIADYRLDTTEEKLYRPIHNLAWLIERLGKLALNLEQAAKKETDPERNRFLNNLRRSIMIDGMYERIFYYVKKFDLSGLYMIDSMA